MTMDRLQELEEDCHDPIMPKEGEKLVPDRFIPKPLHRKAVHNDGSPAAFGHDLFGDDLLRGQFFQGAIDGVPRHRPAH